MTHKIAVVFDPTFGDLLCSLAKAVHVWITHSPINDEAIRKYLDQNDFDCDGDPLASGITKFDGSEITSDLLESIWDHHGDFAHDPPLSEMRIIGLTPDQSLLDLLLEFGFEIVSREPDEFTVVVKSKAG